MSTSKFLIAIFLFLAALSGVAVLLKDDQVPEGKTPLVWVSDNNPARTAQIEAFNAENPDLYLTLDYSNRNVQKVILQCSSGVGPDIFDVYNPGELQAYVEAGVAWDLTDRAAEAGFDALGPNLWPGMRENVRYLGRQYSYPCNSGVNILIYNKNVFDHLGIAYPEGLMTWEEFIDLGIQVRDRASKGTPAYAVTGLDWITLFDGLGGEYFTEEGKLQLRGSQDLMRALQMHKDLIFKHRLMPSTLDLKSMSGQGGWGSGGLNQFSAGRFAMAVTGEWALLAFSRTYRQQIANLQARGLRVEDIDDPLERPLRLGCVLLPVFSDRAPCYGVGGRTAAINVKSPRREEALRFLQYLAGPTYSRVLNESADSLPGNPAYAEVGIDPGPEDLSRVEMHKATMEGMKYGYSKRKSPFLLLSDVERVLRAQMSRMESDPRIEVEQLIRDAEKELTTLLRRNLAGDPSLRKLYLERFGSLPE
jgi:ABC-type glycerol-3-phosphate transport system substrate-binding protein